MKRALAIGMVLAALLALPAMAEGLFLGSELVPWLNGEWLVMPIYTFGWEGPATGSWGVGFLAMGGLMNPAILNGWYMGNMSVLMNWFRTDVVRIGLGFELWVRYVTGRLVSERNSINGTVQIHAGGFRVYGKAHLPVPVRTDLPYLGATLSIGGYLVLPTLFPKEGS